MAQTIKLKRSATQGAVPSTSQLELGEVAINTYDGKMYIKKNDGSDSVVEIGGGSADNDYVDTLSFATGTGVLTAGRTGSLTDLTVDLDGRYLELSGGTLTGTLQITKDTDALRLYSATNGAGVNIEFSDHQAGNYAQQGYLTYYHSDGASYGSGNAFVFSSSESSMTLLADGKLMYKEGIYSKPSSGTGGGTRKDANWDTAYGWGNHASAGYLTGNQTITLSGDVSGSGTTSINVTVADDSHNHHRLDSTDDRDMKPNTSGIAGSVQAIKPFFGTKGGMTGSDDGNYHDILVFDTYSDSSGGGANAISFDKGNASGNPEMYIWHGAWNASTWGTGQRVFADNYHPNADKWTTARTLSLTGDVTGSVSWDGSANASLTATIADDSHNHVISNVDGLQSALDAKLASSSYTASDVLTKIKTVDGSGSGLDADTVDGIQASSFLRSDANDSTTGTITYTPNDGVFLRTGGNGSSDTTLWRCNANAATNDDANHGFTVKYMGTRSSNENSFSIFSDNQNASTQIEAFQIKQDGELLNAGNKIWTAGNDGSGSGLDADTVDGIQASSFLRSDANDSFSHTITGNKLYLGGSQITASSAALQVNGFQRTGTIFLHEGTTAVAGNNWALETTSAGVLNWDSNKVWTSGNDGSGSGLDADTVDGVHAGSFLRSDASDHMNGQLYGGFGAVTTSGTTDWNHSSNARSGNGYTLLLGSHSNGPSNYGGTSYYHPFTFTYAGYGDTQNMTQFAIPYTGSNLAFRSRYSGSWGGWYKVWTSGNDGSGSGLDADLLDGQHASAFASSSHNHEKLVSTWQTVNLDTVQSGDYQMSYEHFSSSSTNKPPVNDNANAVLTANLHSSNYRHQIAFSSDENMYHRAQQSGTWYSWNKMWTAGNDGSGSGLDADTVDGIQASSFLQKSGGTLTGNLTLPNSGQINFGNGSHFIKGGASHGGGDITIQPADDLNLNSRWVRFNDTVGSAGEYARISYNGSWINSPLNVTGTISQAGNAVWHSGNDGSGSGLDADTLDGIQGGSLLRSDADDTASGTITMQSKPIKYRANGNYGFTFCYFQNNTGSSNYGLIYHSGSSMIYGTSSDYRLKENIVPLEGASERVKLLPVKRFNFIDDPSRTVDGFLAHELQEHLPEAVAGEKDGFDEDGNPFYQAVDQSKLTPLLTAALQEALAKIEELEQRIENLENN